MRLLLYRWRMKIRLLAVGQKMPKWVDQTFNAYNNRLNKSQQIELQEIAPIHRSKTTNIKQAIIKEGENIASLLKPSEKIVVLDEHGESISTKFLAQSIEDWQMQAFDIAIVIGGADGIAQEIKNRAFLTWSLSRLTFPHPLVRVILMEQIYRAYSLIANHPYHRE
ncbi:MAG TPA: 23S rRNA (pseudouridine(1915)-N(3))-methyltransferase RlmH [Oceanospirillales bacterium]|nr:23S rRNA (pseudouridine(1915)-N(3))-methyltransferase RlmH [Oceanospirillales bacterium]